MGRPVSKTFHQPVGKIRLEECAVTLYSRQLFTLTADGYLMSDESVCLDSPESVADTAVVMIACQGIARQKWSFEPKVSKTIQPRISLRWVSILCTPFNYPFYKMHLKFVISFVDFQSGALIHLESRLCLDLPSKSSPEGLTLQKCSGHKNQRWLMEQANWDRPDH